MKRGVPRYVVQNLKHWPCLFVLHLTACAGVSCPGMFFWWGLQNIALMYLARCTATGSSAWNPSCLHGKALWCHMQSVNSVCRCMMLSGLLLGLKARNPRHPWRGMDSSGRFGSSSSRDVLLAFRCCGCDVLPYLLWMACSFAVVTMMKTGTSWFALHGLCWFPACHRLARHAMSIVIWSSVF